MKRPYEAPRLTVLDAAESLKRILSAARRRTPADGEPPAGKEKGEDAAPSCAPARKTIT